MRAILHPSSSFTRRCLFLQLGRAIATDPRRALAMAWALEAQTWGPLQPSEETQLGYLWPVMELHAGRPRRRPGVAFRNGQRSQISVSARTSQNSQPRTSLHPDWLAAIGHVALLPMVVAAARSGSLGVRSPIYVPVRPRGSISNEMHSLQTHLLSAFDELVPLESGNRADEELSFYQLGRPEGSRGFWESFSWLEEDFLGATRPFAESVASQSEIARALLEDSLPKDFHGRPIVGFHARTPGYHAAWNRRSPQLRDFDITSLDDSIDEVLNRGWIAVRFGDLSMSEIRQREGLIDFTQPTAKHTFQSYGIEQWHVLSQCAFMIGGNSGWQQVAELLHVPLGVVNYVPVGIPPWITRNLYALSGYENPDGDACALTEVFDADLAYIQNARLLGRYSVRKNSSAIAFQLLLEMIARLEGPSLPEPSVNEVRFKEICEDYGVIWKPRLSPFFASSHEWIRH